MDGLRRFSRWFAVAGVVFFLGSVVFDGPVQVAAVWMVSAIALVVGVVVVDAVRGRR